MEYNFREIEKKWQKSWKESGVYHVSNVSDKPKFYVLDMFPYPSGTGLHVGHPLGYIGTDVFARYWRMRGHNVLHAMGYDAFGLPAEQYAVQTGQHPRVTTEATVANMRRQLRALGLGHDPRRGVATTDVAYYRWTQWIFLQIFGSWYDDVADRARPIAELEAEFAAGTHEPLSEANPDDLPLADLALVDWPEPIKVMQRNWIGRSVGANVAFPVIGHEGVDIEVFTT